MRNAAIPTKRIEIRERVQLLLYSQSYAPGACVAVVRCHFRACVPPARFRLLSFFAADIFKVYTSTNILLEKRDQLSADEIV